MFRRIAQFAQSLVKVNPPMRPPAITKFDLPPKIENNSKDAARSDAYLHLVDALKELSVGPGEPRPPMFNHFDVLSNWNQRPLESLSTQQLEELARALHDGIPDRKGGFLRDEKRAVEVWRAGAEKNSVDSIYCLAVCHREGKGTERNPSAAFELMYSLLDKDYPMAHFCVGIMLSNGEGTEVDDKRAFECFQTAAQKGAVPALYNIANSFASGRGVSKDDAKALYYYEAAVRFGDPAAKFTLANWLYKGHHVAKDAQRAFALQKEAAEAGHAVAMFNLGAFYTVGEEGVVEKDLAKAAEWYQRAAERGVLMAAVNLGKMYMEGNGVDQDLSKAREILSRFKRHEACAMFLEEIDAMEAAQVMGENVCANDQLAKGGDEKKELGNGSNGGGGGGGRVGAAEGGGERVDRDQQGK